MANKEIKIAYREYDDIDQLGSCEKELAQAAIEAIQGSYAPFSHFNVGAAVRLDDGEIIKGANQENVAYPSGICAERTALFYAGASRPGKAAVSIAIAASQNGTLCAKPISPCGACRQVMVQSQIKGGMPISVILIGAEKICVLDNVYDLLPFTFDSL